MSPRRAGDEGVCGMNRSTARRFAVGVLRHADEAQDAALLEALVDEARRHREVRPA